MNNNIANTYFASTKKIFIVSSDAEKYSSRIEAFFNKDSIVPFDKIDSVSLNNLTEQILLLVFDSVGARDQEINEFFQIDKDIHKIFIGEADKYKNHHKETTNSCCLFLDSQCNKDVFDWQFDFALKSTIIPYLTYETESKEIKSLIFNLNDIFFEVDLNGFFVFLSPSVERNIGYTPDEIIGKHITFVMHYLDVSVFKSTFEFLNDQSEVVPKELRMNHKDGRVLYFLTSGGRIIYRRGKPYGFSGIFTNISRQKETENHLKAINDNYLAVLKGIPDLVFRHNSKGTIVGYYTNTQKTLYVPEQKLVGTEIDELPMSHKDKEGIRHAIRKCIETQSVVEYQYTWLLPTKPIHFEVRFSAVGADEVLGIVRDVNDRIDLEKMIQENERNYHYLVENSRSIIMRIGDDSKAFFINDFGLNFFGYSLEEIENNDIFQLIVPKYTPDGIPNSLSLEEIINGSMDYYFHENENVKKNGERVWIAWTNTTIYNDKGEFQELLCVGVDRTRQKNAELTILRNAKRSEAYQKALSILYNYRSNNLEEILRKALKIAAETLNIAKIGYWSLGDDDTHYIESIATYYLKENVFSSGEKISKESIKDYLTILYKSRKLVVNDVRSDSILSGMMSYFLQTGITSLMDVLIRISDKNIGIVCFEHIGEKREWTLLEEDFAIDISDRISFEFEAEARRKAEADRNIIDKRFRSFIENSNDIIINLSVDGKIDYISPNVEAKTGLTIEYFINSKIVDIVHSEDLLVLNELLENINNVDYFEHNKYLRFRIRHQDSTDLWFRASVSLINESGALSILLYLNDINEIVKAEDSLKENRKILQSIFDTVQVGIALLNSTGRIDHINKSGTQVFGYFTSELIGRNFYEFMPDYIHNTGKNVFAKLISEGRSQSGETVIRTKAGANRYISVDMDLMANDKGERFLLVVFSDITDKKRNEDMLRNAKEQAEKANKLKSEFLANISHEIRTPLNSIIGFVHLLLSSDLNERQKNYLHSIKSSGKNLLAMINDIIDLSKIESGMISAELKSVNIYELLDSTFEQFKSKAQDKGINLMLHIEGKVPLHIMADELRIAQMLHNLIDNAIKYTESGFVRISAIAHSFDLPTSRADLSLIVEDSGIGIASSLQEKIFEPFAKQYTSMLKESAGFGTGLSLVNKIAQLLGYEISLDSQENVGSKFSIKMKDIEVVVLYEGAYLIDRQDIDKSINKTLLLYIENEEKRSIVLNHLSYSTFDVYVCTDYDDLIAKSLRVLPSIVIADKLIANNILQYTIELKTSLINSSIPLLLIGDFNSELGESKFEILESIDDIDEFYASISKYIPEVSIAKDKCHDKEIKLLKESLRHLENSTADELKIVFQKELIPMWEKASKSFVLSEISEFANKVEEVSIKYSLSSLQDYSSMLGNCIKEFDFENLPESIKQFENVINVVNSFFNDNPTE